MKSIYNDNLVPTDPDWGKLENQFYQDTLLIFQKAQQLGLNLREVSHQLGGLVRLVESDLIIQQASEKLENFKDFNP